MATKFIQQKKEGGFALLMTLIVVGVLISIGVAVLDLSVKQVRLATNAKESETAFHAANAGVECAQYWRRIASTSMESGAAISPACFSATPTTNTVTQIVAGVSGFGSVYLYDYSFSWGVKPRCTKVQTLVINAVSTTTVSNMTTIIPGYPTATSKACGSGEKCTIISTRGYNRLCTSASGYGSVEREVLLQF
jgi:Tfp pilus assembly protein PilX